MEDQLPNENIQYQLIDMPVANIVFGWLVNLLLEDDDQQELLMQA